MWKFLECRNGKEKRERCRLINAVTFAGCVFHENTHDREVCLFGGLHNAKRLTRSSNYSFLIFFLFPIFFFVFDDVRLTRLCSYSSHFESKTSYWNGQLYKNNTHLIAVCDRLCAIKEKNNSDERNKNLIAI